MLQCFERSGFNPAKDRLIFLGDAADVWPESPESMEELMRAKNLVYLLGNHDIWLLNWLRYDIMSPTWLNQGGWATIKAYGKPGWQDRKADHLAFLEMQRLYHVDEEKRLYVHAGIEPGLPLEDQDKKLLVRDRKMFAAKGIRGFKEVFMGHSPTTNEGSATPLNFGGRDNIWRLDTGAGWNGQLTIMDVATKEYWQSDPVAGLYPGEKGRM